MRSIPHHWSYGLQPAHATIGPADCNAEIRHVDNDVGSLLDEHSNTVNTLTLDADGPSSVMGPQLDCPHLRHDSSQQINLHHHSSVPPKTMSSHDASISNCSHPLLNHSEPSDSPIPLQQPHLNATSEMDITHPTRLEV